MPLSHLDLAGEPPLIEHCQRHTQALLMRHGQSPCAASALLRAQVIDLLEDASASGLRQEHVLATCLEAVRQLRSSDPDKDWSWKGDHLQLIYRYAIGNSQGKFLTRDILAMLEKLPDEAIMKTLDALGPTTSLEQSEGLPDPERLIVGASLTLIHCYLLALDGALNARYSVGGRPSWVDAHLYA